jgi:hypothetical protein
MWKASSSSFPLALHKMITQNELSPANRINVQARKTSGGNKIKRNTLPTALADAV